MRRLLLSSLLCIAFAATSFAQQYQPNWQSLDTRKIPAWFNQSKFGIFIHWGVYSVPSYSPVGEYAEWYWNRLKEPGSNPSHISTDSFHTKNYGKDYPYENFAPQFKAELFNPDQWANIFKRSGAKYVVLTSKHHEGFALWPSAEADKNWGRPWNSVTAGPHRDLLGDLSASVRNAGLKMGIYYSLYEWYNPIYLADKKRYVAEHYIPQFKDVVTRYKPSVIFADGEWELSDTAWRSPEVLAWLFNESPVAKEVVVNDRWGGNIRSTHKAVYYTSEYGSGMDKSVVWEENRGIGYSYGFNRMENIDDYRTSHDLIIALCDIVSRGGNLLLDIGPDADGTIPVVMQQRLLDIGNWLNINGEAIYETTGWKKDRQWSGGSLPEIKSAAFRAEYDVAKLSQPQKDGKAHIELFFTQKGKDLFAIVTGYKTSLLVKDISVLPNTIISLLGSTKKISYTKVPEGLLLDLSKLTPADIKQEIFTLKISNAGIQ